MKISKTLLQAMLIAVAAGAITSCKKPSPNEGKRPATEKRNNNQPVSCPACGMG